MNTLLAKIENPLLSTSVKNLTGVQYVQKILSVLISAGFVIGGVAFTFMFITGAISWITSGGDKAAHEEAKSKVSNAVLGLFILFIIFALINLIEILFQINIMQIDISGFKIRIPKTCGPSERVCVDENGASFCWPAASPCPI